MSRRRNGDEDDRRTLFFLVVDTIAFLLTMGIFISVVLAGAATCILVLLVLGLGPGLLCMVLWMWLTLATLKKTVRRLYRWSMITMTRWVGGAEAILLWVLHMGAHTVVYEAHLHGSDEVLTLPGFLEDGDVLIRKVRVYRDDD